MTDCATHPLLSSPDPAAVAGVIRQGREGNSYCLMMSLTHYATGTSPIIFGSGYTTLNEWWITGLVMSVVNLLLLVVVGSIWWGMLGYY